MGRELWRESWRQMTRPVGAWGLAALAAVFGSQTVGYLLFFLPDGWAWLGSEPLWLWLAAGCTGMEAVSRWLMPAPPVRVSPAFRFSVRGLVWGSLAASYGILFFLVHIAILAILNARTGVSEQATLLDSLRCFCGANASYPAPATLK